MRYRDFVLARRSQDGVDSVLRIGIDKPQVERTTFITRHIPKAQGVFRDLSAGTQRLPTRIHKPLDAHQPYSF